MGQSVEDDTLTDPAGGGHLPAARGVIAHEAVPGDRHRPVLMVDPGSFTPYYDINLIAALGRYGWKVNWVTSEFEFESIPAPPGLVVDRRFFRVLGDPRRRRAFGLRRLKLLRTLAKGASYPIDLARFTRTAGGAGGILHVQWAHVPRLDALAWAAWRRRGWKIVHTIHDVTPLPGTTPRLLSGGVPRLVALADAVVVHTMAARAEVVAMGGLPDRVHVMPPAAPLCPTAPERDRHDARVALGLPVDTPTVLFFGFVKPYKGLDVLVRSLPAVIDAVGPVRLVVAGEMMASRSRYRRLAERAGVASAITWADGFIPSAAAGLYFTAADVVALPYVEGSASGVLLTAYAHRRPVVASDVGGAREFVDDGETGLIVPPSDPGGLAQALATVLLQPELADRMGERAGRLAREHYTWEASARCLDEVYRGLPG